MSEFLPLKVCSICGMDYVGIGNNAQPINEGRCCDWCDMLVTARRINDMKREMKRNAISIWKEDK